MGEAWALPDLCNRQSSAPWDHHVPALGNPGSFRYDPAVVPRPEPPKPSRPLMDDESDPTCAVYIANSDSNNIYLFGEESGIMGAGEDLCEDFSAPLETSLKEEDALNYVEEEESRLNTSTGSGIMTTVPPCMLKNTIATETGTMRHIPTRSSLRHSRMLVNSSKIHPPGRNTKRRISQWIGQSGPMNDRRIGAILSCLQLILGLLQIGLAVWILLLWSPMPASLHQREIPHWSGAITVAAGMLNLAVALCRPKDDLFPFEAIRVTKILCVIFSTGSVIACLCSSGFSGIHLVLQLDFNCIEIATTDAAPPVDSISSILDSSLDHEDVSRDYDEIRVTSSSSVRPSVLPSDKHYAAMLASLSSNEDEGSVNCVCRRGQRQLSYLGLRCVQVRTVLHSLLLAACIVSAVAALASTAYLCLMWASSRGQNRMDAIRPSQYLVARYEPARSTNL